MKSFVEKRKQEDVAWAKFEAWLKEGDWISHRFRDPEASDVNIDGLSISEEVKIKLKRSLHERTCPIDGFMSRMGIDNWLFNLKSKSSWKYKFEVKQEDGTWIKEDVSCFVVDQPFYETYHVLNKVIPFLIVFYINIEWRGEDRLYLHRVQEYEAFGICRRWNSTKSTYEYLYIIPQDKVFPVLKLPWLKPKSLVDYFVFAEACKDVYKQMMEHCLSEEGAIRFIENALRDPEMKDNVIEGMKTGYPPIWQVPLRKKVAGIKWNA